jgi:type I restriction-modification system DNA methylase subunit
MSCAIKNDSATNAVRKKLLEKHTLKAVVSMPDDLFYPIGVVTCIMVFEANTPNKGKKTWFGYLKDDGFIKRKNKGRIDYHSKWKETKLKFLDAYKNNDEMAGLSVKKEVTYIDEWCAEAYMETNYAAITQKDFEEVIKKYAVFKTIGLSEPLDGGEDSAED